MDMTGVNTCRSNHGCWTCRLRKKKCDENHPSCSTCTSLELACYGYGQKPEWMDRGPLEREKALQVKRVLSQIKSKRRQCRTLRPPQHIQEDQGPLAVVETSLSGLPLSSSTLGTTTTEDNTSPGDSFETQTRESDSSRYMEQWSESFYSRIIPAESFFNGERVIRASNQPVSDAATASTNAGMNLSSVSSEPSGSASATLSPRADEATVRSNSEESAENDQFDPDLEALSALCQPRLTSRYYDSTMSRVYTSFHQVRSSSLLQEHSSSIYGELGNHTTWAAGASEPILCGEMEDRLFMYYLDQVFYVQYPFYQSSSREGRGWLFSILRRAKSAYHAALALSEYHQYSARSAYGNIASRSDHLRTGSGHYNLALREMQLSLAQSHSWSGTAGLVRIIEVLTSILQLLFWEVGLLLPASIFNTDNIVVKLFGGGRENWQMHLAAAATLIPTLVQAKKTLMTQDLISSGNENRPQDEGFLLFEDDSAISFLLGSFILIDIISCASTRSSPLLELDHEFMLESGGINLESLLGCENWAITIILEISLLDKWKKEAEKSHKLSIVELAKRGGQIEACLQEKLSNLETKFPIGDSLGTTSTYTHTQMTKIFALSAMTYLHTVVSGANPELPEIVESVSKTIDAFRSLKDPKLLRSLVWPFCVSGCLALEGQHAFFRGLVSAAEITQLTVGTCLEAFKIIEECWEARKTHSCNCDWVSVMNKWGHFILLV